MFNAGKIYSTLGNPNSLVPLAIKDVSNSLGITACSYATGKEEGEDRFIDEFGTQAIWLFGIPAFKKLFNLTAFRAFMLDSKVDVRILKDKDVFEKAQKYAPDERVKHNLEEVGKHSKLFKNLVTTKFVVATALTVGSYIGLTKIKQAYTNKKIKENLIREEEKRKEALKNSQTETKTNTTPTFKGFGNIVEEFAFSPVKNMYILDGFITGERLKDSRNSQELAGYIIKEGSYLFFMYYAGKKIQEMIENWAEQKKDKIITLDARVIEDKEFQKAFENGKIKKSLEEFAKITANKDNTGKNSAELYEFLHNNPDNMIVKIAKKSDIIELYKDTDKIDTRTYIDLKEIEKTNNRVAKLYKQYTKAIHNGETSDIFFKNLKSLKRKSIIFNNGIGILALGVITPLIMLAKRLTDKSGSEFKTKTLIREELIKNGTISID